MKAVILAAGKSTRTYPLTVEKPKALLKFAGKTLIEHILSSLQGAVDEAVIVVGYHAEMIKKSLGSRCGRIKISYALQKEQKGTGDALLSAEGKVSGRFILLMGDDVYGASDVRKCLKN